MAEKHPGERLRDAIEALGVTYERFGEMVAASETPARDKPYARSNVMEWVAGRSDPRPRAWLAIETVTGKPMRWFLSTPAARKAPREPVLETIEEATEEVKAPRRKAVKKRRSAGSEPPPRR